MSAEPRAWQLTLPCTRAEADAIAAAEVDLPAVLTTSEIDEARGEWRLDAYFDGEPNAATVAAIRGLAPSGGWSEATPAPIDEEDWVTLSQAGLEPIREGRFVVHTGDAAPAADGTTAFVIAAGRAFGTGHHETTSGCLAMLDGLGRGGATFGAVIDIGTGTGLLAFAALTLWPGARVAATDIDPVAIDVARANALTNHVALGEEAGEVVLAVADGARHPAVEARAPYDLVVANILAGPLVAMAPELAAIAAPGATIVLAGLLETQREVVVAAYARCGCAVVGIDRRGDWSILRLTAGAERYVPTTPLDPEGRDGWALDI